MIAPFGWTRLTSASAVEHRLAEDGTLRLRVGTESPPFTTARVRDGIGSFTEKPLASLGLEWHPANDADGWVLRTHGDPRTMTHVKARWSELARAAAEPHGVDDRIVLVTIACEVGDLAPDAEGHVQAPRTERGYPGRTGERDPGDETRDAEDWAQYAADPQHRITHSSHGVMQTLISTAVEARADLFRELDQPGRYREVLWEPVKSIACGVAHLAGFPAAIKADPLATRFQYGSGHIAASTANRWGTVPLYDEVIPLSFVAFWNDLANVTPQRPSPEPAPQSTGSQVAILLTAFALLGLSALATVAAARYASPATAEGRVS
jgi:hypothetical protein